MRQGGHFGTGRRHPRLHNGQEYVLVTSSFMSLFDKRILPFTCLPVAALEKLHAKHALPGFEDRSAEEREIELTTSDITKVTSFTGLYLHRPCHSLLPPVPYSIDCAGFSEMSSSHSTSLPRQSPRIPPITFKFFVTTSDLDGQERTTWFSSESPGT